MSQMMDHLIKAKANPKRFTTHVRIAAQIAWTRLESIHDKMHHKIHNGEPPKFRPNKRHGNSRQNAMHTRMNGKGQKKIPPRTGFLQHPNILQNEIREKMFQLKENKQRYEQLYAKVH